MLTKYWWIANTRYYVHKTHPKFCCQWAPHPNATCLYWPPPSAFPYCSYTIWKWQFISVASVTQTKPTVNGQSLHNNHQSSADPDMYCLSNHKQTYQQIHTKCVIHTSTILEWDFNRSHTFDKFCKTGKNIITAICLSSVIKTQLQHRNSQR
jgi:hypothetical protein